ncbi:MAG: ABC transporter substrate-binding protein, partial [Pseudomonadota bacterium]
MMGRMILAALLAVAFSTMPAAAADKTIRVGVLKFGTVNWLMQTISSRGLDRAEGVVLEVVPLAGKAATAIAFQAGDADMIVTDWVWAMRQRKNGKVLRFSPYSTALGAVVTREALADICGLRGKTVGVVGGELDKSWLVLQALVHQNCGFSLVEETEQLFGAPPLMSKQLENGVIDAVSTYWPFAARLRAAGNPELIAVAEAMKALRIEPAPPLIGFVWDEATADPATVEGFLRAVRAAGAVLATDDAAWEDLRPLMRAKSEAEFLALRDAYRAGIPEPWTGANTLAAQRLYDVLVDRAGSKFLTEAGAFDRLVFPEI